MSSEENAKATLGFIMLILESLKLRWVITGGFACYAYGIKRPITDIDIDIDCSKDDETFKEFFALLSPYISQPLEHLQNDFYDNYNFEASINGQILDICPMKELLIARDGEYVPFYNGFPRVEQVGWNGFMLPLLAKDLILENKKMILDRSELDRQDAEALTKMLA
jgi:hypothetical protein